MPIKLNCDMGESYGAWSMGADEQLMPLVDQANIACGAHAGDPETMTRTVALARDHGVAIGAHPGYPDRDGFGRRDFPLAGTALTASLLAQIGALDAICRAAGTALAHVKPHGALYNRMMRDPATLADVAAAVRGFDARLTLIVQAGDAPANDGLREQLAGLELAFEAFADRAYADDGRLAPRTLSGAVHDDPAIAIAQARRIMEEGTVETLSGIQLRIAADTLCLHGDNPLSLEIARALRAGT